MIDLIDAKKNRIGTAVILCGGKSTRAGMDKQLLILDGMLVAEYIADKLKTIFDEIILVTNKIHLYRNTRYHVVEDIYKDFGPLGGIHSGICHSGSDIVYVTACDMPNVSIPYIKWMINRMGDLSYNADVMAVKWDNGHIEPFNGFYSKNAINAIENAVACENHKVSSICDNLKTMYINEDDLKQFESYNDIFLNINKSHEIDEYMEKIKLAY